jgi:hypothetical protein
MVENLSIACAFRRRKIDNPKRLTTPFRALREERGAGHIDPRRKRLGYFNGGSLLIMNPGPKAPGYSITFQTFQ